jgi:hypothetical protein
MTHYTSPHGSDFSAVRKFLELHRCERGTRHSNGTPRLRLLTIDNLGMHKLPLTPAEELLEIVMRHYDR